MHVGAAALEVQEGRVEGGQTVAIGHASILSASCPSPARGRGRRRGGRGGPSRRPASTKVGGHPCPSTAATTTPVWSPSTSTGRAWLGEAAWFDAHTHIGHNDPDGRKATPDEILGGLDAARQHRALVFAMHEPDGYREANDRVLAAAAASGGRLQALARISPHDPDALAEARRCLQAGALGFKLHPRSDAFGLPHPVVEEVVALADERRRPVLFHAGRGIPHLGEAVADLARRYPGARLILAHAGISDLGWIADEAAELPNLLFDTAWWNIADQLQLYASIPPGQILYASDMPYGPGVFAAFVFLRTARAVGLAPEAARAIAGGQLARIVAGEELLDLGPAARPGRRRAAHNRGRAGHLVLRLGGAARVPRPGRRGAGGARATGVPDLPRRRRRRAPGPRRRRCWRSGRTGRPGARTSPSPSSGPCWPRW